ncbi:hypothetical protein [Spiribacter pallidus]|uniref:Cytochrome oxidase assembly protein n=1 Tax=Spiribacter pallidus TaxID=1987936 RepID=A0ABV3TDM4_9GAMM
MNWLKGRWQLIALLALFILPTAAAMIMVFSDWRPGTFTNNGDLVQPAVQLDPSTWQNLDGETPALAGDWLLVMPQQSDCGEDCRGRLDVLNRIRVALDKDIDRVRIIVLQPGTRAEPVTEVQSGFLRMSAPAETLERLARHEGAAMAAHIVDYRGYHVMRYAEPLDASGLLDDLDKLLRLAKEEAERRAAEEAVSR